MIGRLLRGASVALLCAAAGSAFAVADAGAHYEGTSRDGLEVRIYLHGGAPLGREGSRQRTGVVVELARGRRVLPTVDDCVYEYDEADRRVGHIRCATRRSSPLSGAGWARPRGADADEEGAPMVCVSRCGGRVPARLTLDAHPDNH